MFQMACRFGLTKSAKLLLALGADINDGSPISLACEYGHVDIVTLLLSNKNIELSATHYLFRTACERGHIKIVKVFLEDERIFLDPDGLLAAIQKGYLDIVKTLLSHSRRIDMDVGLHVACENGRVDIVKLLLADERFDVNKLNKEEETPLRIAFNKIRTLSNLKQANDCFNTVNELLKDPRVDVNKSDPLLALLTQISLLKTTKIKKFYDVSQGKILETLASNLFKILTDHKHIDLNQTKISEISFWSDEGYISYNSCRQPFFDTCQNDDLTEYMELLAQDPRVDVNQLNKGQTPLSYCCEEGYLNRVEILLKSPRINIHIPDSQGRTPFLLATLNNHFEIVEKLVKHALYHKPSLLQLPTETLIFLFYDLENFPIRNNISIQWNKVRSCIQTAKNETKETMSAEYAALMIFYRDGYLQYNKNTPINTQRFFKITAQLPEDINAEIALQLCHSTEEIIAPKNFSAALIKTAKSRKN